MKRSAKGSHVIEKMVATDEIERPTPALFTFSGLRPTHATEWVTVRRVARKEFRPGQVSMYIACWLIHDGFLRLALGFHADVRVARQHLFRDVARNVHDGLVTGPLSASSATSVWRVSCQRPVMPAVSLMLPQQ